MDLDSLQRQLSQREYFVGLRETRRAVEGGRARTVIVAADADRGLREELETLCRVHGVSHCSAFSMSELGRICGIDVGAAVVTLL